MIEFSKITFEERENMEEDALLMIKKGFVLLRVLINENDHQIIELTSYAIIKKHCIRSSENEIHNSAFYVLVDWMVPIYINDGNHTYFDFHYHCPDVISRFGFEQTIKSMEKHFENPPCSWEDIPNEPRHYDFYVSTEPKNISDFYEQLEYSFVEKIASEH